MATPAGMFARHGLRLGIVAGAAVLASAFAWSEARAKTPPKRYVTVHQITTEGGATGRFEPVVVTVHRGDVLRFVTDGITLHNVSFQPSDVPGASVPGMMPYLSRPEQVNEVPVDLPPGKYHFQCDPHEPLGEVGTLVVE